MKKRTASKLTAQIGANLMEEATKKKPQALQMRP